MLEKAMDGHGKVVVWDYKLLSEGGSFYQKGDPSMDANYFKMQPAAYYVSEFKIDDGIGGFSRLTYSYYGLLFNRRGRGMLGIQGETVYNHTLGTKTELLNTIETNFKLLIPYRSRTFLLSSNSLLSERLSTYNVAHTGTFRHEVRATHVLERSLLAGTTNTRTFAYDGAGNVITETSNVNQIENTLISTTYSSAGSHINVRPSNITKTVTRVGELPYSVSETINYRNDGLVSSKVKFAGRPLAVTITYGYDLRNNIAVEMTSAAGLPTITNTMRYEPKGRFVTEKTNALGQSSNFDYNHWGSLTSVTDISRLVIRQEYDGFNRLKKIIHPTSYSELYSFVWDLNGNKVYYTHKQDPGNPDTKTWYDKLGRVIEKQTEVMNSQWATQKTTYDVRGNVASSTQPYKNGETYLTDINEYDQYNRLFRTTNSIGTSSISYVYSNGNLSVDVVDQANRVSSSVKDPTGKLIRSVDNGGGVLDYKYYSHGEVKEVLNSGVRYLSYTYDDYLNQISVNDVNAGIFTKGYDAYKRLIFETNPRQQTTRYEYNLLHMLNSRSGSEGTTTYNYLMSGTAVNELSNLVSFDGSRESYSYDNFGRLISKQFYLADGTNLQESYQYDIYGRQTQRVYNSGLLLKYIYDANGYLTKINNSSNQPVYTCNDLNGLGQVKSYQLSNFVPSTNTYSYGYPTNFSTLGGQDLSMTWDFTTGNLLRRRDGMRQLEEEFTYDAHDRLTSARVNGQSQNVFQYQTNGNIAFKSDAGSYAYSSSKLNAVTSIHMGGGVNPNIPTMTQEIDYNSFEQPEVIREGTYTLNLEYGSNYDRIKTVLENNGVKVYTRYFWGDYEKQIIGGVEKQIHYIHGNNGLAAIIVKDATGNYNSYYTFTDHLGSIVKVVNAQGVLVAEQNFDAWGRHRNPANWTYTAIPTAPDWLYRGYTGHEHLPELGLINMNARLYDPVMGRMLSPDNYVSLPTSSQGYNRYSYANNNPLKYVDPDGNNPVFAVVVGALVNGYAMGAAANGGNWDFTQWKSNGKTWGYVIGGAIVGALSGFAGYSVATSGMAFSNTASIMVSSMTSSAGNAAVSQGKTSLSVSLGFMTISQDGIGYLGKEGNSALEDIGYSFGAMANLQDIVAWNMGVDVEVNAAETPKGGDPWSHTSITGDNGNISISVGPLKNGWLDDGVENFSDYMRAKSGGVDWPTYATDAGTWNTPLYNVNKQILTSFTDNIRNGNNMISGSGTLKWNLYPYSCVNFGGRALWAVGVPTLPINFHPFILNTQLTLRQAGIYASPFLVNKSK